MKSRILTLAILAMVLLPMSAGAQNTKEKQLATIRESYAGAMEMLEMKSDPEYPAKDKIVITSDEMWPGSGQHNGKMEIFFGLDLNQENDEIQRFPRFARYTYNIGSQNYYYEVLYIDEDNGKPETNKPIFFYAKTKDYNGKIHECRYYWWNEKLIKEIPADDPEMVPSAEDAMKTAKMIFQIATMNDLWNY
ncbi:MAG: hypothetical protein E7108_00450 [Bacteroidales bacterium]|jgi:hypothetical protein|nr:hypothetical protein [Bacteroidales bacterium]